MKILVAGALGHIGSRLVRYLPSRFPDDEIVMVDDLSTQRHVALFNLPPNGRYRFVELDITASPIDELVAGARAVVHLAAITDATSSFERQTEIERVNFGGTGRVAEACASAGVPLVSISSTSVYGTQNSTVDEECGLDELAPQSPYAESKLREERLLEGLSKTKKLRYFLPRFGTIFGVAPGMRFHTAVNKFCWQAAIGQSLTVWRTAYDQKRPYLDIEDAVRAIAFVIERNHFDNRIYNVLTLNASVRQIVEAIRKYLPELSVTFVDTRIMNQLSYETSDARFRALGFEVQGSLDRAVRETIELLGGANSACRSAVRDLVS